MSEKNSQTSKSQIRLFARILVFTLVAFMLQRTISQSYHEFQATNFSPRDLDFLQLALACSLYTIGLGCFATVWHIALRVMSQNPTKTESIGSYFLSQLGKYVPGKALVVIIRSERVCSPRTTVPAAVACVFIETLAMMAVGAILAAFFVLASDFRSSEPKLLAISLLLAVGAGVPSAPPVFRGVIRLLTRRRSTSNLREEVNNITTTKMIPCWFVATMGWLFLGGSMMACLASLPDEIMSNPLYPADYGVITASVALAMVAGFISLLPGGAGVREYVILAMLTINYGIVASTLAAVILRFVWLSTEVLLSAIFYILMKHPHPS